jgi:serine protease Do
MRPWRSRLAVAILSSAAVAAGFFGGAALLERVQFAQAETQVEASRQQLKTVEDLSSVFREVDKVMEPSVVKIDVTKTVAAPAGNPFRRFFNDPNAPAPGPGPDNSDQQVEEGTGSGVIMETADGYGYILTNNHVAGDATEITITLADGTVIKHGRLMGNDSKTDLAVVRVKADHLIAAQWGNSDELQKGDWVLAFGCPLGYAGTMTHGIVSALNRRDVGLGVTYENFIQVDAPINPGNSGGPLVNLHGEVVGINTAIASNTGFYSGIGFAIPSNQAHELYASLKGGGKIVRGYLGVRLSSVSDDPALAKSFGYEKSTGALVTQVVGNAPAAGKLNDGDIVMTYNGKTVEDRDALRAVVAKTTPGSVAKLTVFRDGKPIDVQLTIGTLPSDEELAAANPGADNQPNANSAPPADQQATSLGLRLRTITPNMTQNLGVDAKTTGAVISSVTPGSVAAKAGLRPGLVITHVGRTLIQSSRDAYDALTKGDLKTGIRLTVVSPDGSDFVLLQEDDGTPSNN